MKRITMKEYFSENRLKLAAAACALLLTGPALTTNIALRETVPSKIFTPNGDGVHDVFTLIVNNPAGSILSQKKIYDLQGFEVADLEVVGDETAATAIFKWNGKDKDGNIVPSGVYIYQLQSEGQSINGTVVVVR